MLNSSINEGVDKSRFKGLATAKGEYVTFVDSDDFLSKNAIEVLIKEAINNNADIVEGAFRRIYDGLGLIGKSDKKQYQFIQQPSLYDDYFISFFGVNILGVQLCGKIYKRCLFEGLSPSGFKMGEDLILNMRMFPKVHSYVVSPHICYNYRYGGLTSGFNPSFFEDLKKQYIEKMHVITTRSYTKAFRYCKIEMANILYSHLVQMYRYGKSDQECRDFLLKEVDSGFIDELVSGMNYSESNFKSLLEHAQYDKFLDYCKSESQKKKTLRKLVKTFLPLLRFI